MRIERKNLIWTLTFLAIFPRPTWSQESSGQSVAGSEVQVAPPIEAPDPSPVSDSSPIPALNQPEFESASSVPANFLRIGLHVSGGGESNPIGTSGTSGSSSQISPLTSALGSINLQKVRRRSQTAINCVSGFTFYGSYGGAARYLDQTQQLEADHSIRWRKGQLTLANSFYYSRGGDFGSSSYGGAGAYNLRFAGGQAGGAANPGATDLSGPVQVPVNQESYINNIATAHLVEHLTEHSSVSLDSTYSIADYLGNTQNLYNGRRMSIEGGYNYQLTGRDALGVEYGYQTFQFTQAGVGDIRSNSVQFVYRRRVSARWHLVLGGGPAFSRVVNSNTANGLRLNSTVRASLQYRFNKSALSFSYNRFETAGFGVFAGGNSDIVQGSISRSVSRSVRAVVDGGYSRVTGIEASSAQSAANPYSYGFAGIAVQRQLRRNINVFASYQLNDESSFCGASSACTAGFRQHIALVGFDWNIRTMRLE